MTITVQEGEAKTPSREPVINYKTVGEGGGVCVCEVLALQKKGGGHKVWSVVLTWDDVLAIPKEGGGAQTMSTLCLKGGTSKLALHPL